jgi:release factor glutamine methyltransferase
MCTALHCRDYFDCIVCNPPYIPTGTVSLLQPDVSLYEPRSALDGGADGLLFYHRAVEELSCVLRPGGLLALEIGFDQGQSVPALFADSARWVGQMLHKDLGGRPRVVTVYKSEGAE